jgi:sorbose reductase
MVDTPVNSAGHFSHNNTTAPTHNSLLSLFSLKGRTAIVTGTGAGIGLSVAQGLAEAGADVALWYYTNTKAIERAAEIEKKYGVKCMLENIILMCIA